MAGKKKSAPREKAGTGKSGSAAPGGSPGFWTEEKCRRCPALCCRYIALDLGIPHAPQDFDNLRWYLDHKNVSVYVQDGRWFLCVDTPCRNLVRNRCRIHGSKPELCRRHDPAACEFDNPDFRLDREFRTSAELEAWIGKRKQKTETGEGAAGK